MAPLDVSRIARYLERSSTDADVNGTACGAGRSRNRDARDLDAVCHAPLGIDRRLRDVLHDLEPLDHPAEYSELPVEGEAGR